jgi:hypothetical protein
MANSDSKEAGGVGGLFYLSDTCRRYGLSEQGFK